MQKTANKLILKLKKILPLVGSILGICSIIFVAIKLKAYAHQINLSEIKPITWGVFIACIIAYGFANLALAVAWQKILLFLGISSITREKAVKIYALSQLAKYVPGNIVHLAGRQFYTMAEGLPAAPIARSIIWELGLIAIVGTLFGILTTPLIRPSITTPMALITWLAVCLMIFKLIHTIFSSKLAKAFLLQLCFLAINGILFTVIFLTISNGKIGLLLLIPLGGAYVIAWLIGLITPGAPAGIGIREAVLLFLLSNYITEQTDLLLAVLLGRIISILGDTAFFLAAKFRMEM